MNGKQENCDLKKWPTEFAVRVLDVVESLPNSRAGNHAAGQFPSLFSFITPCSILDIQSSR